MEDLLKKTFDYARETCLLNSSIAVLEWDQHAMIPGQNGLPDVAMPVLGGDYRAEQITWLSGLAHQRQTDPQYGEWLQTLAQTEQASDPLNPVGGAIRGLLRDYLTDVQLPEELVKAAARATSIGQQVWAQAKGANDFKAFQPALEEIVKLRREEATILQKTGRTKYDSLLDQYEEGADSEQIAQVFASLRKELVSIVQSAIASGKQEARKLNFGKVFPKEQQRLLSRWVAEKIGFDFERGRLDETEHPFCTTLGPHDHRILTRYFEDSYSSGLYGVLHEAGHGMYEQGTDPALFGLPSGAAASLGVHESQSRLWENMVGRSDGFWRWLLPHAQRILPALGGLTRSQIINDLNRVEPSLIRIEADEATYNLHIFVRFELEKELIDGNLKVCDLPEAWHSRYREYLGIQSSTDTQGVLQDVHWSAGLIGYFPTYTLGNIYAAQLMQSAGKELGDLEEMFAAGEFKPLLEWLRTKVHRWGRTLPPHQLMERVNGVPLQADPLIDYLKKKLLTDN